jgi:phage pi2 protein 07
MIQKYFSLDKNYILERAQLDLEEGLILHLIDFSKTFYLDNCNPLGIEDNTVKEINAHNTVYTSRLEEFYRNLAAVYRFKFGQNQLEFLFDGVDHYTRYKEDWSNAFKEWLVNFCMKPNFLRAVLELTVFYPEGRKSELAENRMKTFINQHFELKIYKYKGIVRKMA